MVEVEGGMVEGGEGEIQVGVQEEGRVGEVEGGMVEGGDSGRGAGRGMGWRSRGRDGRGGRGSSVGRG